MVDLLDFSGKTVLMTGGSTGIGNGIARAFRDHGADVIVTASKGGLGQLTQTLALARAWGPDGIRVNALAPGFVDTKITRISRDNPKIYDASLRSTPLGRWGTPEDMGHVALFLASEMAAYMTGHTIPVDGGSGL